MNTNNYNLSSVSYIHKLQIDAQQEDDANDPFAVFDALTPDEPIWPVQIAKRGLKAAEKTLASLGHDEPYAPGLSMDPSLVD